MSFEFFFTTEDTEFHGVFYLPLMKGDSFLFVILSNSEGSECIAQPSSVMN